MISAIGRFFGGIPTPYLLLGSLLLFIAALVYADHFGYTRAKNEATAARLKEVEDAQRLYKKAVARGNALSTELAKKEEKVVYQTQETIKYVYKSTSNRPCLSGDTVRVLNGPVDTNESAPASAPATEDATPVASDTDVAVWAAEVRGIYATCATRLNTLIDYVNPQSQPAVE